VDNPALFVDPAESIDTRTAVTPLQASEAQDPDVVFILLKAGANRKLLSDQGKTAFDYAKANVRMKGTEVYLRLDNARL
jgi:hypothetical protein